MTTNEHPHAPRPKFDTLFADPRHYRGDCRLMRTAIKRGWLDDAPQVDREALVARFEQASRERREADPANARASIAEAWVVFDLVSCPTEAALALLRYSWDGKLTSRTTGRPRERWHVSEHPNRIDANEIRRRAKADGTDLGRLAAVRIGPADNPDDPGERIALAAVPDARYGWRVWLVCPRCQSRRTHLYPVRAGVRCRKCAGIAHAKRQ